MRLKQKLKTFFKTRDTSDEGVEFFRMFLLPFIEMWDPNATVDQAIAAFFAMDERRFFHGYAKKDFLIPGSVMVRGNRPKRECKDREVAKGQYMLIAADRRDQTMRVDTTINNKYLTFLLTRAQTEFLKDYVEITPA